MSAGMDVGGELPRGAGMRPQGKYANQWELMEDVCSVIDYRIYIDYKYHQWLGPDNDMKNMLGLVVSREEFENTLSRAAQTGIEDKAAPDELEQLRAGERVLAARLAAAGDLPILRLFDRFGLDSFERWCVLLAYAGEVDAKYERLFAYLQDDITLKRPTAALAVTLFIPRGESMEEYQARFARKSVFTSLLDEGKRREGVVALCSEVISFLSGGGALPAGMRLFDGERQRPGARLAVQRSVGAELDGLLAAEERGAALLHGAPGCGKRFQVEHLMTRAGERCLFADMDALEHSPAAVARVGMLARLNNAYVCLTGLDVKNQEGDREPPSAALMSAVADMDVSRGKLLLTSSIPLHIHLDMPVQEIAIEPVGAAERLALFRMYLEGVTLAEDVSLEEVAYKFRFQPGQVRLACEQAAGLARMEGRSALDSAALHRACYSQVVHKLDALASRVRPNYTWDDVVLPERQKRLMQHACAHIRYQHQVYYGWGFDKKISYGRGLSILFAGAPGTGKTMCAQVMAKQLRMEMYKVNISQIVSKYIGETEKNLQAVFAEAKNSNCILFFDECDALFSKRSDVKDSHDRNANVEVAYLLQQIEEYDGVCVLATNLVQNIDAAFMRRITYVVHFPFPDAPMRAEIYRRTLPENAPVGDDVDFDFLAEKFQLSGGHIKNIVLSAAFMAAADGRPIGMRHMLNAAINELKKNEIVVVREELREYADLID